MINLAGSRSHSSNSYKSPGTNEPADESHHADFQRWAGWQPALPLPLLVPTATLPNPAELRLAFINPTSFQHRTGEARWKRTRLGGSEGGRRRWLGSLSFPLLAQPSTQPSLERGCWCSSARPEHPCLQPGGPGTVGSCRPGRSLASSDKSPCPTPAGNAAERQRGPAARAARTRAWEMSVILGCIHKGGGRNVVTQPHGTRSPLQGCCLQCSHLRFQPEQENLERVQKRAGSESRQWKICITVTEWRSSGCLVYWGDQEVACSRFTSICMGKRFLIADGSLI